MATVVSQHVRHIDRHLGVFKILILHKTAAIFTEISRKHVFAASNRNIIKIEFKKRNYNKFSQTFTVFYFELQFAQLITHKL